MTDIYTGPGEFLTIGMDEDYSSLRVESIKAERHVDRYRKAVDLSGWGRSGDPMAGTHMAGRWLDCACGSGYGVEMIVSPWKYVGVDRNPAAIDRALENFSMSGRRFFCADIGCAEYWMPTHGPFDVILSLETIEHLCPAVQDIWVEAAAGGLTDNGVFVLACPIGNDGPSEYNRYHLHEPSLDGLNTLLSRHFKSVEIETEPYIDTAGRDAIQAFAVCR